MLYSSRSREFPCQSSYPHCRVSVQSGNNWWGIYRIDLMRVKVESTQIWRWDQSKRILSNGSHASRNMAAAEGVGRSGGESACLYKGVDSSVPSEGVDSSVPSEGVEDWVVVRVESEASVGGGEEMGGDGSILSASCLSLHSKKLRISKDTNDNAANPPMMKKNALIPNRFLPPGSWIIAITAGMMPVIPVYM